jgi:hypothetical protein
MAKNRFGAIDWILSALSILIIILYVRGAFFFDTFTVGWRNSYFALFSQFGAVAADFATDSGTLTGNGGFHHYRFGDVHINWWRLMSDSEPGIFQGPIIHDYRFIGFRFSKIGDATGYVVYGRIPSWFLLALFAPRPLTKLLRLLRNRKSARPGMTCKKCGYDLRGSSDRCPECGTSFLGSQ